MIRVSRKLVVQTQRVQGPIGERRATEPKPSLARGRVTGRWMRRQEVNGPVCASPENSIVAVAEAFIAVEGNTRGSAEGKDREHRRGVWHRHEHKGVAATWEAPTSPARQAVAAGRTTRGRPECRPRDWGSRIGPKYRGPGGSGRSATPVREGPDRAGRRRGDT